jgi:hypothetical protein
VGAVVAVEVGVADAVGVAVPLDAWTVIVPVISGWRVHLYLNVPTSVN